MIIDVDPKALATRLRASLAENGTDLAHSRALELVATQLGFRDWNTCAAASSGDATDGSSGDVTVPAPVTIPILRTFPGDEARRFYLDFLGFTLDWEHRFEPGMPLYQQVSREGCVLHLSEHHGDATPGSAVRIEIPDVRRLRRQLRDSPVYPLRIGLEHAAWGDDLTVPDPFGNRIIFHTPRRQEPQAAT